METLNSASLAEMRLDAFAADLVNTLPRRASKSWSAQQAFGKYSMPAAKNPAPVRYAMGHADRRATLIYEHPDLEPLRDAIDHRNQPVR